MIGPAPLGAGVPGETVALCEVPAEPRPGKVQSPCPTETAEVHSGCLGGPIPSSPGSGSNRRHPVHSGAHSEAQGLRRRKPFLSGARRWKVMCQTLKALNPGHSLRRETADLRGFVE